MWHVPMRSVISGFESRHTYPFLFLCIEHNCFQVFFTRKVSWPLYVTRVVKKVEREGDREGYTVLKVPYQKM
jgi:hypothetical protein